MEEYHNFQILFQVLASKNKKQGILSKVLIDAYKNKKSRKKQNPSDHNLK